MATLIILELFYFSRSGLDNIAYEGSDDSDFDDDDYDKITELYSHIWYGNGAGTSDKNR